MQIEFKEVVPYFIVKDVTSTAEFYRDVMGFAFDRIWGTPPDFVIVRRGKVQIMFKQGPSSAGNRSNLAVQRNTFDAYFYVTNVDGLAAELKARGAEIVAGPVDRPHGCREVLVKDRDGYVFCFGQEA